MTTQGKSLYSKLPNQRTLTLSLLISLLILQLIQLVIILPLLSKHFWLSLSGAGLLNALTLYIATAWLIHSKNGKVLATGTGAKLIPITLLIISCIALFLSSRLQLVFIFSESSQLEKMAFLYTFLTYAAAGIAFSTSAAYTVCKMITRG